MLSDPVAWTEEARRILISSESLDEALESLASSSEGSMGSDRNDVEDFENNNVE
jgi:hypothetical protein